MKKTLCLTFCMIPVLVFAQTIHIIGEPFPRATNADGTGVQFEMATAIFKPLGYQMDFAVYPYKRAISQIESGKADIIVGIYKYPSNRVRFSKLPEDADKMVAIYPKRSVSNWQGIQSLAGKRIEATPGFKNAIQQVLTGIDYHFSEVTTKQQALKKLIYNRADFMIDTEAVFLMDEINRYKPLLEQKQIGFFKIYAAFATTEKAQKLQRIWEQRYPVVINSEVGKSLYMKWGLAREYQIIKQFYQKDKAAKY